MHVAVRFLLMIVFALVFMFRLGACMFEYYYDGTQPMNYDIMITILLAQATLFLYRSWRSWAGSDE